MEHPENRTTRRSRIALGGALITMGALHVAVPKTFERMIPDALGAPRFWNLLSAATETASGALLLSGRPERRRLGGALATATFVGVYPANIKMALDAGRPTSSWWAAGSWARLPLQFPLIAWALRHAKGPGARY
ncbi:MAG: hypothetical protein ABI239_12740 [Aquihabitans sp.]